MDLKLNDDNDIFTTGQDLTLTSEEDEVIQELNVRLQFFQEEWFLDITAGLPYLQTIFQKGTSLKTITSLFINEINEIEEVDEILEFDLDFDNNKRVLTVTFKVQTVDDGIIENTQIITI